MREIKLKLNPRQIAKYRDEIRIRELFYLQKSEFYIVLPHGTVPQDRRPNFFLCCSSVSLTDLVLSPAFDWTVKREAVY